MSVSLSSLTVNLPAHWHCQIILVYCQTSLADYQCPLLQSVYLRTVIQNTVRLSLSAAICPCPIIAVLFYFQSNCILFAYLCLLPHARCPVISALLYSQFICALSHTALSDYLCLPPHVLCPDISVLLYSKFICELSHKTLSEIFFYWYMVSVGSSLSSFTVSLPVHCHTTPYQFICIYCHMSYVLLSLSSFTVSLSVHFHTRHCQISFSTDTRPLSDYLYPILQSVYLALSHTALSDYLRFLPHVRWLIFSVLFHSHFISALSYIAVRLSLPAVPYPLSSYRGHLCKVQSVYLCIVTHGIIRLPLSTAVFLLSGYFFPRFTISFSVNCRTRHRHIIFVYCHRSSVRLSLSSFTVSLHVHCHTRH